MCLSNLLSRKEVEEFKEKLPDEFFVWKVMDLNGFPEFHCGSQDTLQRKGIHKAKQYESWGRRARLTYPAGFHVFRLKEQAETYREVGQKLRLRKFKAKRKWVQNIGFTYGGLCLILSHIEVI